MKRGALHRNQSQTSLRRERKDWRSQIKIVQQDDETFICLNQYSWDLVIVFEKEQICIEVVKEIVCCGLQVKLLRSAPDAPIFCKVRADRARLELFADHVNKKMLLNKEQLKILITQGDSERKIKGRQISSISREHRISKFDPFEYIYARYDKSLRELYAPLRPDPLEPSIDHPFHSVLRIELIVGILQSSHEAGGACLKMREMLAEKQIAGFYCLHNKISLDYLSQQWFPLAKWPWQQPFEEIKCYFGVEIAFYFYFLGFYATWLIPCAVLGMLFSILTYAYDMTEGPLTAAFGMSIALWGIIMLEFWKREQSNIAFKWGMSDYEYEELDRPEFTGIKIDSPVDGSEMIYFPHSESVRRRVMSESVIVTLIFGVLGCLSIIYLIRHLLIYQSGFSWNYAQVIVSLINGVQIMILDNWYSKVAIRLNNRENHRTDTQYQNSLISKLFLFKFVNSYASFIYIAFVSQPAIHEICHPSCLRMLMNNLILIFTVNLVGGNIMEVLVPFIRYRLKKRKNPLSGYSIEEEFHLPSYDLAWGILFDYAELAVQFGYSTLFVSAFPLCPLMGMMNNYVEIRSDAFKLINMYQRPLPHGAQDIGTWLVFFEIMTVLSVLSNSAIVCFVMKNVWHPSTSFSSRLWAFFLFQAFLYSLLFCVRRLIPDVPKDVELQMQRTAFFTSKAIDKIPDPDDGERFRKFNLRNIEVLLDGRQHPSQPNNAISKLKPVQPEIDVESQRVSNPVLREDISGVDLETKAETNIV